MNETHFASNISGTSLPHTLTGAAVVEHEDSFLILGGYDGSSMSDQLFIYSYKEEREEWEWEEVPTPLSEKRQYLTAINVKATIFQSC